MSLADTAELIVLLRLKDQVSGPLKNIDKNVRGLSASVTKAQDGFYKIGAGIGTGLRNAARLGILAVGALTTQVAFGISALSKLEAVTKQTNVVLKSTKGVAGESAKAIRDLANKYEDLNATIDDKVIQSAENILLTFTNVRKKAFEPTLKAILDLNTALGRGEEGLQGTTVAVGKALNDPIKGLTALQRLGITFTDAEKKKIKTLVKANETYKAQQVILDKLNTKFGGSFLGQGNTTAGKIAKVRDAVEDLQMTLAEELLPVVGDVAVQLNTFLRDPATVEGVRELGREIGKMFSNANIARALEFARDILPTIRDGLKLTASVAKGAIDAFNSLPPELKSVAIAALVGNKLTGGLVASGIGDIAKSVLSGGGLLGRGATPANPVFVSDVSLGGGKGGGILDTVKGVGLSGIVTASAAAAALVLAPIALWKGTVALAGGEQAVLDADRAGRQATAAARGLTGPVPGVAPLRGSGAQQWMDQKQAVEGSSEGMRQFATEATRTGADLEGMRVAVLATARNLRAEFSVREALYKREKKELGQRNRIGLLTGAGSKHDKILDADTLAQKFAHANARFYKSSENAERTLSGLKALQARFLAQGDTKSAAKIGRDIKLVSAAIKRLKPPIVKTSVVVNTTVSVRDGQKQSIVSSRYGQVYGSGNAQ